MMVPENDNPTTDTPGTDDTGTQDTAPEVGDAGKRAIQRERDAAREATRQLNEVKRQLDELRASQQTEHERAVEAAREDAGKQAREDAVKAAAPRLVSAEFRVAAAGRIDADRLATLTEDVDLTKYLNDAGDVDVDKVKRKVDAWAPARRPGTDPSQGSRGTGGSVAGEGGRAEAARRFATSK